MADPSNSKQQRPPAPTPDNDNAVERRTLRDYYVILR